MAERFRLEKPELAGEPGKLSRQAKLPREVERLRAVSMAMSGDFTLEPNQVCGRSRSAVGQWMGVAREQGLAGLMGLHLGRGRSSAIRAR